MERTKLSFGVYHKEGDSCHLYEFHLGEQDASALPKNTIKGFKQIYAKNIPEHLQTEVREKIMHAPETHLETDVDLAIQGHTLKGLIGVGKISPFLAASNKMAAYKCEPIALEFEHAVLTHLKTLGFNSIEIDSDYNERHFDKPLTKAEQIKEVKIDVVLKKIKSKMDKSDD